MTRYLAITVLLFTMGCDHVTEEPHEIRIDTPDGEVIAHDINAEATPQYQDRGNELPVFDRPQTYRRQEVRFRSWSLLHRQGDAHQRGIQGPATTSKIAFPERVARDNKRTERG